LRRENALSAEDVEVFCDAIKESKPMPASETEEGYDFGVSFTRKVPPSVITMMNQMIGAIPGLQDILKPGQLRDNWSSKSDHFDHLQGHFDRLGLPLLDWHHDAHCEVMSFVYVVYKKNLADCAGLGKKHKHNKTNRY
jgi:hypothetical protein